MTRAPYSVIENNSSASYSAKIRQKEFDSLWRLRHCHEQLVTVTGRKSFMLRENSEAAPLDNDDPA
jgi:hypothetical protein